MTTNNPPIAAWAPSTALAKLASRHNSSPCVLTDGPAEFNDVALIRLNDYEALQAELADMERDYLAIIEAQDAEHRKQLARLQAEREELRSALAESRSNDLTAMGYLNQIRQLVGGDDFPDMVERVAKLQAECAQLRAAIRRLCNLYVVDDYYMGQLREERLEAAVNRAINAVKEPPK